MNIRLVQRGRSFSLPEDYLKEFERLKELVKDQRAMGREIVKGDVEGDVAPIFPLPSVGYSKGAQG